MSVNTINTNQNEGNTSPHFDNIRARRVVFTLNNWTNEEYEKIKYLANTQTQYFCIGKEVGENNTPHLQGYLEFKNAIKFKTLKDVCNRLHLEKAKGNKIENFNYCSKDGNYISNIQAPKPIKIIKDLRDWQQKLLEKINKEPDDRTIMWYWNEAGNVGKSAMAKYLAVTQNALVVSGTVADVKYLVSLCEEYPRLIIWDLSRDHYNNLSYSGLEDIKNGLFASTKYECKMVIGNSPHIIVFANAPPKEDKLSKDRWDINIIN